MYTLINSNVCVYVPFNVQAKETKNRKKWPDRKKLKC